MRISPSTLQLQNHRGLSTPAITTPIEMLNRDPIPPPPQVKETMRPIVSDTVSLSSVAPSEGESGETRGGECIGVAREQGLRLRAPHHAKDSRQ